LSHRRVVAHELDVRSLERFVNDVTAWRTLPHEVSAWGRRRTPSSLERDGLTLRIVGLAAGEACTQPNGGQL
jgi:hypothetical protein